MKGTVSFHPVDLSFFDDLLSPLIAGKKVNPDAYLADAQRTRRNAWQARRYPRALEAILTSAEPPPADPKAGLWKNLRARLEQFDHRPDDLTARALHAVDPDLHLGGRPFFIVDATAEKVADAVDSYRTAPTPEAADGIARAQLEKLDAEIARSLEPVDGPPLSSEMSYRADVLAGLKETYDLANASRQAQVWGRGESAGKPAIQVLQGRLAWLSVSLHARAVPFWTANDVDGLETICRAAGVDAPNVMAAPWRLFAEAIEEFPSLKETLHGEVSGPKDVGAFVAPGDLPDLLEYLNREGARIISAATRQGEGQACMTLLRKIKECATYAARHGFGYLEASGVPPSDLADE